MKYKVENKYIKQKENEVKKIYRASDNYIVVISENIPEEFGVVSATVKPELQSDADDIKTYILEKKKLINKDLKEESQDFY
ncbi:hypothetical protein IEQ_04924 [Bacillus cereus BAG6X1-2]|nr:hypothetical protein IEQ_04924 [Bacillus cereus BAG6X1-2]